MANENTQSVHLTAKEFDLLYLLFRLVLKEENNLKKVILLRLPIPQMGLVP